MLPFFAFSACAILVANRTEMLWTNLQFDSIANMFQSSSSFYADCPIT